MAWHNGVVILSLFLPMLGPGAPLVGSNHQILTTCLARAMGLLAMGQYQALTGFSSRLLYSILPHKRLGNETIGKIPTVDCCNTLVDPDHIDKMEL